MQQKLMQEKSMEFIEQGSRLKTPLYYMPVVKNVGTVRNYQGNNLRSLQI